MRILEIKFVIKFVQEWLSNIHYHKSKETVAYLGLHRIIFNWKTFYCVLLILFLIFIDKLLCVCWSFRILNLACMKYFKIFWSNKNLVFAIINLLHGWWFLREWGIWYSFLSLTFVKSALLRYHSWH